ncbi:hypothetical protein ABW20_dc0105251 [Dactylellina cionopaga]|nr:hypothetical protein ABW20_dc0105251 [Dactylellina cionopaga]
MYPYHRRRHTLTPEDVKLAIEAEKRGEIIYHADRESSQPHHNIRRGSSTVYYFGRLPLPGEQYLQTERRKSFSPNTFASRQHAEQPSAPANEKAELVAATPAPTFETISWLIPSYTANFDEATLRADPSQNQEHLERAFRSIHDNQPTIPTMPVMPVMPVMPMIPIMPVSDGGSSFFPVEMVPGSNSSWCVPHLYAPPYSTTIAGPTKENLQHDHYNNHSYNHNHPPPIPPLIPTFYSNLPPTYQIPQDPRDPQGQQTMGMVQTYSMARTGNPDSENYAASPPAPIKDDSDSCDSMLNNAPMFPGDTQELSLPTFTKEKHKVSLPKAEDISTLVSTEIPSKAVLEKFSEEDLPSTRQTDDTLAPKAAEIHLSTTGNLDDLDCASSSQSNSQPIQKATENSTKDSVQEKSNKKSKSSQTKQPEESRANSKQPSSDPTKSDKSNERASHSIRGFDIQPNSPNTSLLPHHLNTFTKATKTLFDEGTILTQDIAETTMEHMVVEDVVEAMSMEDMPITNNPFRTTMAISTTRPSSSNNDQDWLILN